eukprot:4225339-Pyramimonas_sp.AAC.1
MLASDWSDAKDRPIFRRGAHLSDLWAGAGDKRGSPARHSARLRARGCAHRRSCPAAPARA